MSYPGPITSDNILPPAETLRVVADVARDTIVLAQPRYGHKPHDYQRQACLDMAMRMEAPSEPVDGVALFGPDDTLTDFEAHVGQRLGIEDEKQIKNSLLLARNILKLLSKKEADSSIIDTSALESGLRVVDAVHKSLVEKTREVRIPKRLAVLSLQQTSYSNPKTKPAF